jgi:hypothetical protein
MGVINSPLGKIKQSVGNITFANWKGINVVKAKATEVSNPQTAAQLKQRAAMTFMVGISRPILSQINLFWSKLAVKMSQYNAFVKENLSKLSYVTDHWELPATDFKLTKGTLLGLGTISAASSAAAGTVVVTLSEAPDSLGYTNNVNVYGVAMDVLGNVVSDVTEFGDANSLSGTTLTITNSTAVEDDVIQVFVWAYDTYERNASDSSTIRQTVTA